MAAHAAAATTGGRRESVPGELRTDSEAADRPDVPGVLPAEEGEPTAEGRVEGEPTAEGRVQDNPDFRGLPREFQKAVEAGGDLAATVADAKKRGVFGKFNGQGDPAGGSSGGGAGGGGGGGGATGGGGGLAASDADGGEEVSQLVKKWFTGILDGTIGSFTKEKEALLNAELIEAGNRKKAVLIARAKQKGISRGLFRSGLQLQIEREIGLSIEQEKSRGVRQVKMARIQAQFQDKMAGLQMAQTWLDSKRRYELGKEQIQASREASRAQISLGYAGIAAQKDIARMSAGQAGARLGLAREQFEFSRTMALEARDDRRQLSGLSALRALFD